jgi:hypothetical protein
MIEIRQEASEEEVRIRALAGSLPQANHFQEIAYSEKPNRSGTLPWHRSTAIQPAFSPLPRPSPAMVPLPA